MKVLVIGNPIAGGGKAAELIPVLERELEARDHAVEVHFTERAGDAEARAARIAADVERIVVAGGDGTLNEVLNGLPDPGRVPLAQLPTGTANILAHELGLPKDPAGTAALLDTGEVRRLDMGLVAGRRFLMVVSAGFDAMVTQHIRANRLGKLGYRGYVKPVLRVLKEWEPTPLLVSLDDEPAVVCESVIASNTRNYGGLFRISNDARPDSGHLHVCLLEKVSIVRVIALGLAARFRGLAKGPGVTYRRAQRMRLRSHDPVPVEIDGDYAGSTPIDVELRPGVIPVLVPRGSRREP